MTALVLDERETTTRRRHRLLGGWRDVLDDIRLLSRSLTALPDECECGHGAAHLKGTCPCCHQVAVERVPDCGDCDELLARLRGEIDLLAVDTFRFFPVVREVVNRTPPNDLATRGHEVENEIGEVIRTFAELVVMAERFRTGCRVSHLKTVKALAETLRRHAEALEHDLYSTTE